DSVVVLHAGFGSGPAGRRPPVPGYATEFEALADAEKAVLDLLALFELVHDALHTGVERDGIAAGTLAAGDAQQRGEQADPVAPQVQQRPAAGARRDRQTGLQQRRIVEQP